MARLWVLAASACTVVAWWQDSSLSNLMWPGIVLLAPGKCVRLSLFQRVETDALHLFNASTIWLMVGTWGLTLILALMAGWIARPSTSIRGTVRLLATSLAMYALAATAGLLLAHLYGAAREADYYASTTYTELVRYAFILLIAPSAVLFFASWLVRGFASKHWRRSGPDALPAEPAT
jgi:hypothetical protein